MEMAKTLGFLVSLEESLIGHSYPGTILLNLEKDIFGEEDESAELAGIFKSR
ncbi:MAG TPA: hypothetical protein VKY19_17880 [Ktedonosporobacter sp.]|nr:hypothetical protein [Ktedonosporobacter sp.]